MNNTLNVLETVAVAGVTDSRHVSLIRLASERIHTAAADLRLVLPAGDAARVSVAAFNSSI